MLKKELEMKEQMIEIEQQQRALGANSD